MKLTNDEICRLRAWREGDTFIDTSRRPRSDAKVPILHKVAFGIVDRYAHKKKTTVGKLRAARKAIDLVLAVLTSSRGKR